MILAKEPSQVYLYREIPSTLERGNSTGHVIRKFLDHNGLAAVGFKVELIARECLNNAIVHGNRRDARRKVILELRSGRKWIRLRIADAGVGFDWRKTRRTPMPESTVVSGRGLSIVTLYASRISFNRRGNQISVWLDKETKGEPHHGSLHN